MKIFILTIFFGMSAWARLTDNQIEIKVDTERISLAPKKGFHLNAEAPASATFDNQEAQFKPSAKTEQLFVFRRGPQAKTAQLSFYVCDDKKTVCEQHRQTVNLGSGQVKNTEFKADYSNVQDVRLASADGRPTLLMFSAPWCPACIRMQTETYPKSAVQKSLKQVNFVKLNSDVAANSELREKFKIRAIPTTILLDKSGNETYRWLDYQPAADFAAGLTAEIKKVDQAEALLRNAQLGDPQAAGALGMRAFNTLDYAEAVKWFSLAKSEKDQKYKLSSEVLLAAEKAETDEDPQRQADFLQTLEKAISLTTSQLDRIRWTMDYLELKKTAAEKENKTLSADAQVRGAALGRELAQLRANSGRAARAFAESTYGEYRGFEKEELLWLEGRLYTILNKPEEKKRAAAETARLIARRKLSLQKPGELLLALSYLQLTDEKKKVETWFDKLVKQYPQTYVYFEKYARFLRKNKELTQALNMADEAVKFPQGNLPQLNLLKAQILSDLQKKSEALALIDNTLDLDYIQHRRFAATRKDLQNLKAEIGR